ncbi:hypothetical protein PUN28_010528 [Cardiocondyla obscurior]|uniref:Uncharacterized protein n=1 Tax=Cardiocondyla obscurior TaxID=286306 RepID=A0AAW2FIR1_9HYME
MLNYKTIVNILFLQSTCVTFNNNFIHFCIYGERERYRRHATVIMSRGLQSFHSANGRVFDRSAQNIAETREIRQFKMYSYRATARLRPSRIATRLHVYRLSLPPSPIATRSLRSHYFSSLSSFLQSPQKPKVLENSN